MINTTTRKFISINTESGGRRGFKKALTKLRADPDVDAFMFQEVHYAHDTKVPSEVYPNEPGNRGTNPIRARLHQELQRLFGPAYEGYFAPQITNHLHDLEPSAYNVSYGQSLFVRRGADIRVRHLTKGCIYRNFGDINQEDTGGKPAAKSMIAVTLEFAGKHTLTIGNVHGFWSKHGKVDMPERFIQNRGITNMLVQHNHCHAGEHTKAEVLLIGDLNYTSQMKSLANLRAESIFGVGGGIVLNHRHDIRDTRTKHYQKAIREADFAIISQQLDTRDTRFSVDTDFPSDHAALIVEIDY